MDWIQFAIFFIGVFSLFIWNRTESRAVIRQMYAKLYSNRDLIIAMNNEVKDFHFRLLEIERARK